MREVNYDERWKVARDLACKINLWPTVENLRHLDAALRRAKAEALREMKTALTSQSGTSAWDVVSYIEARIIELEREGE